MAYRREKNGDIVIEGFEKGIGASPHLGIANLKNVNIATEMGEAMCSFNRVQQSQTNITAGTLTQSGSTTLVVSATTPANTTLKYGQWITTTGSLTNLPAGTYWVGSQSGTTITLSTSYNGTPVSSIGVGSVTFTIIQNTADTGAVMSQPVATQTETYTDSNNATQYRYYILDSEGHLWVKDTGIANTGSPVSWALVDTTTGRAAAIKSGASLTIVASGLGLINGWLFMQIGNCIITKETCMLGVRPSDGAVGWDVVTRSVNSGPNSLNPHFMFTSQSTLYYCDGNFIGSIFPNPANAAVNSFSYGQYTVNAATDVFTVSTLIGGVQPYNGMPITFTSTSGDSNIPAGLSGSTIYYVINASVTSGAITFKVSTTAGGSAVNITGTGTGTQFFNTLKPLIYSATATSSTFTFTPQALTLTSSEVTTAIVDSGVALIIGTQGKNLYQWDRISPLANNTVPLSEANITYLLNVNNMTYAFAGNKGNVYITNGSTASVVISVPDYCAGVPGTPATYIEPYFTWGGVMFLRGRIYFGIQDQTASKAGNCGGIWSFVPTNNLYIGQDTGMALRLENQNSYNTYNGMATLLLPFIPQNAIAPQYYSGWQSTYTGTSYGVDATDTTSGQVSVIETDLIPTGTTLDKKTFKQVEYKVSSPLANGETIQINCRANGSDAWTSCGTVVAETSSPLSGYFNIPLEKTQWLQFQAVMTPLASASSSFCRLQQLIFRQ